MFARTTAHRLRFHLLLAASLCVAGCGQKTASEKPAEAEASPKPVAVEVNAFPSQLAALPDQLKAVGSLKAIDTSNISPKVSGQVTASYVRVGDYVHKGQPLVSLDTEDVDTQLDMDKANMQADLGRLGVYKGDERDVRVNQAPAVRKAQAALESAGIQWERTRTLYRDDLVSQKEVQDAKSALLAAQADLASAVESVRSSTVALRVRRAQESSTLKKRANSVVRAPFDGWVASMNLNPGDFVSPGGSFGSTEYLNLVTIDPIECELQLSQADTQRVRPGQAVTLTSSALPGETYTGKISSVGVQLDEASRTLSVRARLANPSHRLRPGLYSEVVVKLGVTPGATMVPRMAQLKLNGDTCVYVVEQGKDGAVARLRKMERGRVQGSLIEAIGLKLDASTQVVVTNQEQLYDGAPIRVAKVLSTAPAVTGDEK